MDLVGAGLSGSQGEMVPPQVSPRRTDHVGPQNSTRQQGTSQTLLTGLQGSSESTLVSLLSQPPSKDDKQLRRGSGTDQELPSTKVKMLLSLNGLSQLQEAVTEATCLDSEGGGGTLLY